MVQLNFGYLVERHRDLPLNGGGSVVLADGDYRGGDLVIEGHAGLDARWAPVLFDGRWPHWVSHTVPGLFMRVSIVFFSLASVLPAHMLQPHFVPTVPAGDFPFGEDAGGLPEVAEAPAGGPEGAIAGLAAALRGAAPLLPALRRVQEVTRAYAPEGPGGKPPRLKDVPDNVIQEAVIRAAIDAGYRGAKPLLSEHWDPLTAWWHVTAEQLAALPSGGSGASRAVPKGDSPPRRVCIPQVTASPPSTATRCARRKTSYPTRLCVCGPRRRVATATRATPRDRTSWPRCRPWVPS